MVVWGLRCLRISPISVSEAPRRNIWVASVTELMGARRRCLDAGALERMPNDRSNSTLALKAPDGSFAAKKHATAGAARAAVAQVRRDRRADLRGKGKRSSVIALAADAHRAGVPVNIVELEKGDFPGTQPQSRQQQHDRIVAPACRPCLD